MKISVILVPFDSGYHNQRLAIGPGKIAPVLVSELARAGHEVTIEEVHVEANSYPTEITRSFQVNRAVANKVKHAKETGALPVTLSGNCNAAAIPSVSVLEEEGGVIWFDCHGDFNTPETTVGGFLDGMALAMLTGKCWTSLTKSVPGFRPISEDKVVLVGARDFDDEEMKNLSASPLKIITPQMVRDKKYTEGIFQELPAIYLHIDLDVIDPQFVLVNEYNREGGVSPEELYEIVTFIRKQYIISSVGFTSYDPSFDAEGKVPGIVCEVMSIIAGNS